MSSFFTADLRECFIKYFAFGKANERDYSYGGHKQKEVTIIEILFSHQKDIYTALIAIDDNNQIDEEYSVLYNALGKRKDCSIEQIKEFYSDNMDFIKELLSIATLKAGKITQ